MPPFCNIRTACHAAASILLLYPVFSGATKGFESSSPEPRQRSLLQSRASDSGVRHDFEVYPPVLTANTVGGLELTTGGPNATTKTVSDNTPICQQTLVVHTFANSYGQPYVGAFNPPSCAFNRVTWNLTVTSQGVQYDRLGSVSLGDIEVFRTSTAEPTSNGIFWTYFKDMTSYLSLFKEEQTLIFDLANIVDNSIGINGVYNVTLTASYFTASDYITPADLIVPVSLRLGSEGKPSYFTVPSDNASNNLTLPQNVKKAVFTVAATGQSQEEFWWSNVLQSEVDTFDSELGQLDGYSPFREVQLFIDGSLAGVAWPYPIIFTGGVAPGLWSPIVGIDVFDLQEDEIDITPWLPLLCDGNQHNFTLKVSGLNDHGNGTATLSEITDSFWWVSGKIFVWLDEKGHVTTGSKPLQVAPSPSLHVSSSFTTVNGVNETLYYDVEAHRNILIESTINLSTGPKIASWFQSLDYSNTGNYTQQGLVELNTQETSGYAISSNGYARKFSYPLYAYSVETILDDGFTLFANIERTKDVVTLGQPVFPTGLESFSAVDGLSTSSYPLQGTSSSTTQNGTALYGTSGNGGFSFGTSSQNLTFAGVGASLGSSSSAFPSIASSTELFEQRVVAVNGSVVSNVQNLLGNSSNTERPAPMHAETQLLLAAIPGRGQNSGIMSSDRGQSA